MNRRRLTASFGLIVAAVALAVLLGACAVSSGTTTVSRGVVTSTTPPAISVVTPPTTEGVTPQSSTSTVTAVPAVPLGDIDLDVELVADGFRQPIWRPRGPATAGYSSWINPVWCTPLI